MAVRTHHRRVQDQLQGDEKPQRQRKVKLAKKILTVVVIYFILFFPIFFVTFYHQILGLNIQPLQQYRDAGIYKLLLKSIYMLLEKEKDPSKS